MKKLKLAVSVVMSASILQGCLNETTETSSQELDLKPAAMTQCATTAEFSVTKTNGLARDIAVGPNSIWVIGTVANGNGYRIYQRVGAGWQDFGGGATRITVKGDQPIVSNSAGVVWYLSGTWVQYPYNYGYGSTRDVGAVPGYVYQLGGGGLPCCGPYYFDGSTWKTQNRGASGATQISGHGSTNDLWVVNKGGTDANPVWEAKFLFNGTWETVATWPTEIYDITGAGNGVAYVAATDASYGGLVYRIKFGSSCVEKVMDKTVSPAKQIVALRISARDDNNFWFTNSMNSIHSAQR